MSKQKWWVEVYPEAGMRVIRLREDVGGKDLEVIENIREVEWQQFTEINVAVRERILHMLHLREGVLLGLSPS